MFQNFETQFYENFASMNLRTDLSEGNLAETEQTQNHFLLLICFNN